MLITVELLPKYPVRVTGDTGISAEIVDGDVVIKPEFESLSTLDEVGEDSYFVTFDADGVYSKTPAGGIGGVAIDARLASEPEAEAGTDNTKLMTPLRTEQHANAWLNRGLQQVANNAAFTSSAFYNFLTHNDLLSTSNETHLDTRSTLVVSRRATGSGYQSQGASDIGLIVSSEKLDYLSTTEIGELNGLFVISRNGRRSDSSGVLVDTTKVYYHNGVDDSGTDGGSIVLEMSSRVVDPAGDILNLGQTLVGWFADERSLGQGYRFHGCVVQSRKGNNHAAFMTNSIQPFGSPSNYKYAFLASSAQEQVTQFYAVGGDGNEKPGAVYLGPANHLMALWYDGGSDALKFMSGKVVNDDNSTANSSVNLLAAQLTKDGDLFVRQSLQLSTGALLKNMLRGVYTLNPGVITAGNAFQSSQTLTGVGDSDEITVTLGSGFITDKIFAIARKTSTDTITIYIMNYGTSSTPDLSNLVCYVSARQF